MSTSTASKKDILHFGEGHRRMNWKKLAVTLLIVLPMLAAMVYMWAMYDPSKSLRDVDLAVVNEDAGVEQDGEKANFGESVVEGLLGRDYLSFSEVSADEAKDGLANGKYLFTVTIPQNFSKDVATLMDDEPKAPEIEFEFNDFNGTNGSVLTGALVPQIKTSVSSSISESYAERLIGGVNQLGGGIKEAAAGSKQLDDGAKQIDGGLTQSYDGTAQLNAGAQQLNAGTQELATGTGTLVGGTTQLRDGVATLVGGTKQLGDGAGQIDAGVGRLTGTAIPALKQAQNLAAQVRPVIPMLRQVGLHDQANKLQGVLSQLDANNPENLVTQLQTLKNGTATLHYMLSNPQSEYYGGVLRLQDGIGQVHNGAVQLNDGAGRLNSGSGELASGTEQLLNGQSQLKAGSTQLKDGTNELATKLGEGAEAAPTIGNVEASSKQVAVPINYVETNSNPVQLVVDPSDPTVKSLSGGASMLMIMVFGFLLMAVAAMSIPHVFGTNRRTAFVGPTLKSFIGLVVVGLAIMGVLAVGAGMVGWSPASKAGMALAFLGMASAAAATNQMLRALFGRVTGALAMLALFALGLFSFGGVWPLSTVPKIFQFMHPLTPMKYGRDAFVTATQGDLGGTFTTAIIALAIFTLIPLIITLTVRANRVRKVNREFEAHEEAQEEELVDA